MSNPDLTSRIAARNKARVDRLTLDIVERGIDAAIEFAQEAIEGNGETGLAYRRLVALAIAELNPDEELSGALRAMLWHDRDVNLLLREHCALAIERGEELSPALRAFASAALQQPIPANPRGRKSAPWQQSIARLVLRDMKFAGIPVYEGDGSNGKAAFTGVEVITKVLAVEKRTVRKWWQDRDKKVWDI